MKKLPSGNTRLRGYVDSEVLSLGRLGGSSPVVGWICINQDDNDEKSHQVCLMRRVYQTAARVLVNIGGEYEDSQLIPELVNLIQQADFVSRPLSNNTDLPPAGDQGWAAFRALLRRPWFRRVWVFQEFIVATAVVFFCGGWTLMWDDMLGAIVKAGRYGVTHIWTSYDETFERNEASGNGLTLVWWLSELRGNFWRGETHRLLSLLNLFRWSLATRPHDHVFAFLGIARDGEASALPPDYVQPFEEVSRNYARYFVGTQNAMEMLYCAGISHQPTPNPSWIPDWTQNEVGVEALGFKLGLDRSSVYHASKDSSTQMFLADESQDTLIVKGGIVDKVIKASLDPSISSEATSLSRLLNWFASLEEYAATLAGYPTGKDLIDVQCRTMLSNVDLLDHELPADTLAESYLAYRKYFRRAFAHDETEPITPDEEAKLRVTGRPVAEAVGVKINGRKPCLTERGFLGHVPDATRPEDLVAILLGSTVPFVIRRHEQDECAFRLVGESYIHGIMKGEAYEVAEFCPVDIRLR